VFGACEHDPLSLCEIQISQTESKWLEPPPAATSVVDAAINLFAQLVPLQDIPSTTRALTQLLESVRSPKLEKNSGRKAAVLVNATIALVLALRRVSVSHFRRARETFGNALVTSILAPFLKVRHSLRKVIWIRTPNLTMNLGHTGGRRSRSSISQ
jgi:hypothetical protein